MNPTRVALGYQMFSLGLVGVWALFFPLSFYQDFPGLGMRWVSLDGAYNEHLIRDVGSLNLGISLATLYALVSKNPASAIASAIAALVYSLPHLLYHAHHIQVLPNVFEQGLNMVLLGANLVASLLIVYKRGVYVSA